MTIPRGDAAGSLVHLVNTLMADGELDEDDLERIRLATAREHERIASEKAWRETAHVHDEPHIPVHTLVETEGLDPEQWPEETDASGVVCCDCRKPLVSDAGSRRILVCPSLHGRRPGDLLPTDPDGAVECGRS